MTILCAVAAIQQWAYLYEPIANVNGVDPRVVAVVIWVESRGQPDVYSVYDLPNGEHETLAVGLMGVVKDWELTEDQLKVPAINVVNGVEVLAGNIHDAGSVRRGLLGYHMGMFGALRLGWERSIDGQVFLQAFAEGWDACWPGQPLPWAAPAREPEE